MLLFTIELCTIDLDKTKAAYSGFIFNTDSFYKAFPHVATIAIMIIPATTSSISVIVLNMILPFNQFSNRNYFTVPAFCCEFGKISRSRVIKSLNNFLYSPCHRAIVFILNYNNILLSHDSPFVYVSLSDEVNSKLNAQDCKQLFYYLCRLFCKTFACKCTSAGCVSRGWDSLP